MPPHLHPLDLALIVVYLLGITLFGLRFRKSGATSASVRSYFLADNTVPWWAIALSIVSAETSTLTIISVPGIAFTGDFGFLQIVLGYMVGRIVVALLFLLRYFEGRMLTAYQLIERRFGQTLYKITAGLFLLTRAAAEGIRVFAVSIVVGIAIGTRDVLSIAIISLLTLLYTFEGGMAAVIWTDVVQMGIYVAGTVIALVTLGRHVPGGWAHIHAVAGAAGKFHLFHFALNLTQNYTFWAGLIGGTFLTMASHGTDQLMVQRMLAARSLRDSRLALLSSGVVIFIQFTLFLVIGAGLWVFYGMNPGAPHLASEMWVRQLPPDRLFPTFIVREMPTGVAGLLVAAILAAAMSNLSAALNSLSSTTVVDFYLPWRQSRVPHLRDSLTVAKVGSDAEEARERTLVSKASTLFWAVILFAVALYAVHAGGKGHVVEIGLSIASVAYGALLGVFLLGTLTRYATQTGAILGMIAGFATNLSLWQGRFPLQLGPFAIPHVAFTWYVFLGALVTFTIGSLASLLSRKSSLAKAAAVALALLFVIPEGNRRLRAQSPTPTTTAQPLPTQTPVPPHLAPEMWASRKAQPLPTQTPVPPHLASEMWASREARPLPPQTPVPPHLAPEMWASGKAQPLPTQTPVPPHLAPEMWASSEAQPLPTQTPVPPHLASEMWASRKAQPLPTQTPVPPHLASEMWASSEARPLPTQTPGAPHLAPEMWASSEAQPLPTQTPVPPHLAPEMWASSEARPLPTQTPGAPHLAPEMWASGEAQPLPPQTPGAPHLAPEMWASGEAQPLPPQTPVPPHLAPEMWASSEAQPLPTQTPGAPHLAPEMWASSEAQPLPTQTPGAPHLASEMWASGEAQPSSLPGPQTYDFTPIQTLLTQAIADKKLPGAVVLIGHYDQIVFHQAFGNRKLAGEPGLDGTPSPAEPMTEDTIFDMASLSKCLSTATAIMQLYEAGKLQFDDPVAKYLPAFAANGKSAVTIRQLLTHYSGLPPDIDLKDAWGLAAPDKAEGLRRALASPLTTTPGTHFEYSDINYIVLGALVEKLSGESLDEYAQNHIFSLLNMTQTRYLPLAKACGPEKTFGSAVELRPSVTHNGNITSIQDYACPPPLWITSVVIPQTAPTARDDESKSNPSLNPNFDHLLRGTVHDPTTRRMGGVAGHAGVFSTAGDIGRFAQALLDKLTRNTGPFPLSQATLRLMTTPEQPPTAESTATIFTPDGQPTKGTALRGFGWDINSAFSRPRGAVFPTAGAGQVASFGHTGFTGTSLWMDPASNTYVILLANAIHPRGGVPISALRGQLATAAAKAVHANDAPPSGRSITTMLDLVPGPNSAPTLTGIDVLASTHYAALAEAATRHHNHLNLGLLTNQTGLDAQGRRTIDLLLHALPQVQLTTLFSPEHGLSGTQDTEHLLAETDPATHLPLISLYGAKDADRRPKPADLAKLDAVVIDLQDAGVHFWTYESVVGYFLEAAAWQKAAGHPLEILLLDRPPFAPATAPRGPVSEPGRESYVDYMPEPVQHGMTLGELARYIAGEKHLDASLTVVPLQNWHRVLFFDDTGQHWTNPSPNLRSLTAALLYPGVALTETTNVSVGRGTSTPFEHLGAPWIDGLQLAAYLEARKIPGVTFTATTLPIAEDANRYPFHGQTIPGIRFTLTDRNALDAPVLGIELLAALHHLYPAKFRLAKALTLLANATVLHQIEAGDDPHQIAATWAADLAAFNTRRGRYLLYP